MSSVSPWTVIWILRALRYPGVMSSIDSTTRPLAMRSLSSGSRLGSSMTLKVARSERFDLPDGGLDHDPPGPLFVGPYGEIDVRFSERGVESVTAAASALRGDLPARIAEGLPVPAERHGGIGGLHRERHIREHA